MNENKLSSDFLYKLGNFSLILDNGELKIMIEDSRYVINITPVSSNTVNITANRALTNKIVENGIKLD